MNKIKKAENASLKFFGQKPRQCSSYGNGHINDTYLVETEKRYILQKVNTSVFPSPQKITDNILNITDHIRSKAPFLGLDASRCTMKLLPTADGKYYYIDEDGGYWRAFQFVEGTLSHDKIESCKDIEICGKAFGHFQQLLNDYPIDRLHHTIENFHNTKLRYENLMNSVKKDLLGRADEVRAEIDFVKEREDFCHLFENAHEEGKLPLRPTHNDTKLNNILFDAESGEAVCIVDLDTVMPGYSVNDFGDLIRFAANTAAEDETDLSKVSLDTDLFLACARGFIEGCGKTLSREEILLLPHSAIMMTLENGMRFLTDYIDGDIYYKITRPTQNIDRARCQFALVRDIESKLSLLNDIIVSFL